MASADPDCGKSVDTVMHVVSKQTKALFYSNQQLPLVEGLMRYCSLQVIISQQQQQQ